MLRIWFKLMHEETQNIANWIWIVVLWIVGFWVVDFWAYLGFGQTRPTEVHITGCRVLPRLGQLKIWPRIIVLILLSNDSFDFEANTNSDSRLWWPAMYRSGELLTPERSHCQWLRIERSVDFYSSYTCRLRKISPKWVLLIL